MKKFLSVLVSLCMVMSVVPAFAAEYVVDDDTVVYISFDEELPEGSTGYNLSLLDEGVYGNCAWFNGSTSYIHLPDNITEGVTDFTMAAWIKPTTTTAAWRRIFDFGSGTTSYAFLGMPYSATSVRAAMKVNGGTEYNVTAADAIAKNEWSHIAYVQEGNTAKVYVNGVLSASGSNFTSSLSAMGATTCNYIGRSQFSGDAYLNAYLDEVVFAKRAMSVDEIAEMGTFPEAIVDEQAVLDAIDIPVKESVKENISLQTEALGYPVTWESSNEDVVYPYDIPNGDYTIPAGKVTRQDNDTTVTLTASVDVNGNVLTKDIDVNIIAKPAPVGDTEAYLYVYFRGNVNGSEERLSIHLASSEDSYVWEDLNGNWPILESTMGTQCLRDPYLLRSHDGDRFYLIATDLNTQDGQGWGPWSLEGSKYLMIWESDDLVNWSEQRMVKFANDDMGCAWAPEAIWDPDTEEYLVYASAKDLTLGSSAIDTVYVVRTRDFRTFSEPEYFVRPYNESGSRIAAIDSNIIQANDGRFYHFYKKWNSQVVMMVSDHASGPYEEVPGFTAIGGEGPGSFLVKGTEDEYCLMIDNYSVYVPYLTTDIASGVFTAGSGTVVMPTGSKHGGFLPVTEEEYARVLEKWGNLEVDEEGSESILKYDFEQDADYTLYGNAKVEYSEERDSNVLVLDGEESYLQFPENLFDRRSTFTLSFDVKNDNSASSNMTFSVGTGEEQYAFFKINDTTMRSALTISGWSYEEKAVSGELGTLTDTWMHIDLVVTPDSITIYKDGVQVAQNTEMTKSIYHLAEEGLSAYLGKSMFSADPYFIGEFDNVELFNRALTSAEIASSMGNTDEDMAKLDAEAVDFGCNKNYVTGNITLPETGIYGSTIAWESSDEDVIALDGTVAVPAFGEDSIEVTLVGTFTYGNAVYTKEYVLTVKNELSYLESTIESAWKTYDITSATGTVTYTYNITADALTDGVVALTSSSTTPNGYGGFSMLTRLRPEGYFDAYNGNGYSYTNYITYEVGKTYPVTIEADIANKTYSVYVEIDGETKAIAENFKFRASNTEIGKLTVMAGWGTSAGLVTVTDFTVIITGTTTVNYMCGETVLKSEVLSGEVGEEVIISGSHFVVDGVEYKSAETVVTITDGATVTVECRKIEDNIGDDPAGDDVYDEEDPMNPSDVPSDEETDEPSDVPSDEETDEPSDVPSDEETDEPSDVPSDEETDEPSDVPSDEETDEPSDAPSDEETDEPSDAPSDEETDEPSDEPSDEEPSEEPGDETEVSFEAVEVVVNPSAQGVKVSGKFEADGETNLETVVVVISYLKDGAAYCVQAMEVNVVDGVVEIPNSSITITEGKVTVGGISILKDVTALEAITGENLGTPVGSWKE